MEVDNFTKPFNNAEYLWSRVNFKSVLTTLLDRYPFVETEIASFLSEYQ